MAEFKELVEQMVEALKTAVVPQDDPAKTGVVKADAERIEALEKNVATISEAITKMAETVEGLVSKLEEKEKADAEAQNETLSVEDALLKAFDRIEAIEKHLTPKSSLDGQETPDGDGETAVTKDKKGKGLFDAVVKQALDRPGKPVTMAG